VAEPMISNSPRGRTLLRTLTAVWYAAVIGVAFQVHFFVWEGLGLAVGGPPPRVSEWVFHGVSLVAWLVLGRIAYQGRKQGRKPAEWAVMAMALLVCAALGAMILAVRA
jgi:hypothetical protein